MFSSFLIHIQYIDDCFGYDDDYVEGERERAIGNIFQRHFIFPTADFGVSSQHEIMSFTRKIVRIFNSSVAFAYPSSAGSILKTLYHILIARYVHASKRISKKSRLKNLVHVDRGEPDFNSINLLSQSVNLKKCKVLFLYSTRITNCG